MTRPRKPTKLKILTGTAQPCRTNKKEPQYAPVLPKPLPFLNKIAKKEWKRLAPFLYEKGLLTSVDTTVFGLLCQSYADWVEACKHLDKEGEIIEINGKMIKNPWFSIASKAFDIYLKTSKEFGLTPAARNKVTAVNIPKKNLFEQAGL